MTELIKEIPKSMKIVLIFSCLFFIICLLIALIIPIIQLIQIIPFYKMFI